MSPADLEALLKRFEIEGVSPPQIIVAQSGEPELTPDILARWVGQVAPLFEAEKVLIDWFAEVGGINYGRAGGFGIAAQSNREGFQGINLYPEPPGGLTAWSTFAQFLEFALEYARQTIQIDEHAKGYKAAVMQMTEELVAAGVPVEKIDEALVAMRQKVVAEINKLDV